MNIPAASSALSSGQVQQAVSIEVLNQANKNQQQVAQLVEDATDSLAPAQEAGAGAALDVQA